MALADSHPSSLASDQTQLIIVMVGVLIILAIIGVTAVMLGRRGSGGDGYSADRDVIVRCRDGHLFTTIWIPFMSLKAIRFGPVRFQYGFVNLKWPRFSSLSWPRLAVVSRLFGVGGGWS